MLPRRASRSNEGIGVTRVPITRAARKVGNLIQQLSTSGVGEGTWRHLLLHLLVQVILQARALDEWGKLLLALNQ